MSVSRRALRLVFLLAVTMLVSAQVTAEPGSPRPLLERIKEAMELVRAMTPASPARNLADEILLDYVRALDPKAANEQLIDDLIFLLQDQSYRDIAARCLQHLDQLRIARKAVPTLLMVLPEEACNGVGAHWYRFGSRATESIRQVLTDMDVEGRNWMSVAPRCDLPFQR
jgi:hypothetical protein